MILITDMLYLIFLIQVNKYCIILWKTHTSYENDQFWYKSLSNCKFIKHDEMKFWIKKKSKA